LVIKQLCIKKKNSGFTFIGLLSIIAISGIALAGVGIIWHQNSQREREKELLYIGNQYRLAIESYYNANSQKELPKSLNDLVLDKRFIYKKRHIRKLYSDPMTFGKPFNLIMLNERIIGVYSTSTDTPIKNSDFPTPYESFSKATNYTEWKFAYVNH
jgi:type II secretory pathway pseudopilin PulG